MGDYHVHLHRHGPYEGVGARPGEYPAGHVERFVDAGLANGAEEIGFTEHLYRCVEAVPILGRWWDDEPNAALAADTEAMVSADLALSLERYVETVLEAKQAGLPVLLGLEVDFFPQTIDAVLDFLDPYPWDFLIGSVHWIGGWAVDYDASAAEFDRRGLMQAYEDYFALETALAASGAVDVLAHVDVVKKHGGNLPEPPLELYQRVVDAAAASDTAVEVSSAGLYRAPQEIYPAPVFLQMFSDAGIPITLASDAHRPHEVGRDRQTLIDTARRAGYTERVRFDSRVRSLVPLK